MTLVSPVAEGPGPAASTLRERLRAGSAAAHVRLEHALGLERRVSDRHSMVEVLERFFGFHLVWERAIHRRPSLRLFHQPRSRVPHLRRDLAALGRTNSHMAALPLCHDAAALAESEAAAVGSIYVLEGSTLGGQVIGRSLAKAAWLPLGGLTYFNPYADRTGEMWRDFGRWSEAQVAATDQPAAVAGANRTFALLEDWLAA